LIFFLFGGQKFGANVLIFLGISCLELKGFKGILNRWIKSQKICLVKFL